MKRKKICICSDTISIITGLGKTALRIARGFYENGYDVCYFVITGQDSDKRCLPYYGEQYKNLFRDFEIYNCQINNPERCKQFDEFIYKEKPDIVFSLLDPWYLDQIDCSAYRSSYTWIAYCLFETPSYPEFIKMPNLVKKDMSVKSLFTPLRKADVVVPVSKMGKKLLEEKKVECTDNIYLGIDFDLRCESNITKEDIFGQSIKNDDFLFMTVGRNSERKKIDQVLEAFAKFLNTRKNDRHKFKLYVHTNHIESCTGTDLVAQMMSLNIVDNTFFPSCFERNQVMLDKDLYKRYKVCDAYVGLSAGEGFGYGYIEALMHNKPVIYIDYGAHREYCINHGYPIPVKTLYNAKDVYMQWALPDIYTAVNCMNYCADNVKKENHDEYLKNNFDWDKVIIPKLVSQANSVEDKRYKKLFELKRISE